jgi:hypothetical protein
LSAVFWQFVLECAANFLKIEQVFPASVPGLQRRARAVIATASVLDVHVARHRPKSASVYNALRLKRTIHHAWGMTA